MKSARFFCLLSEDSEDECSRSVQYCGMGLRLVVDQAREEGGCVFGLEYSEYWGNAQSNVLHGLRSSVGEAGPQTW